MRYKPSRARAREFARQMDEIRDYCDSHGIDYSRSMDSYYFTIRGERYRVSNHTQAASDRGMYSWDGTKLRDSYHTTRFDREHEITAGKTRIISIHQALLAGKKLDKRGNVVA